MPHIIDAKHQFDIRRAKQLCEASEAVYLAPEEIETLAHERLACSEFLFFDVQSTQCFLSANYDELIICFRGTESRLEDWVVDLDFSLVDGPFGGKVHEGFLDGLSLVWSALDYEVRRLLAERPRRLYVTGHSLGGALANLAAAMWAQQEVPVSGVYTYGQPRTGDCKYGRQFNLALRHCAFRIVNDLDIVTRTPPRSMGYTHNGTLIYLTEEGAEDDMRWWQRFLGGWGGTIETILDWCGEGVEDHRITNYFSQLDRLAAKERPRRETAPATIPIRRSVATNGWSELVRPRRAA